VRLIWHSRKGTAYDVVKRTTIGWKPEHAGGSFVTPAAEAIADDVLDRWVDDVETATIDALDQGA
jgi:hypothetical protein